VRSWRSILALPALAPALAQASFLSGDALDAFANGLSWFILCVVPLAVIGLFFYVHVLPELIAERNHHPHKHSIKVLCILSLFFGGMLWPFAWLWAYTKPIGYRAIYGTEKHEDYYHEMGEKARAGSLTAEELEQLRHELDAMAAKGALPPALQRIRDHLRDAVPVPTLPGAAALREKAVEAR
jgi:CBS domain containing-hemolysin-like protein